MNFKHLLLTILLLTLFSFYGCSSQPTEITEIEQSNSNFQGEILEWVEIPKGLKEEQSQQFQAIVTDSVQNFMNLNPQVRVLIEFIESDDTLSKFTRQIKRGAGPDLFAVALINKQLPLMIDAGYLKSLNEDNLDLSQFRPETIKQLRYQDNIYGIPVNLTTQVLCYNKGKIQEIPKTLDDLIIQARKGYSVGIHSGFGEAFWGTGVFDGKIFDQSGKIILAQNSGWIQWIEWLKKATNEPNFFLIENAEILQKSFVSGKLTYITCSSNWLPSLTAELGNDKLGVALLPGQENKSATPPLWTIGFIFNRASNINQHQLALKLAQFLSNAQSQQTVQVQAPFLIPVNKNVTVDFRLFPMQAVLVEQSKTGIVLSLDQLEKHRAFFEYGDLIYHQLLGGQITIKEALFQLNQAIKNQFN